MKRIALLPEGSVSEEAIRYLFGDEPVQFVFFNYIADVFRSTETGNTDLSVVPVENTFEGSVNLHLNWLVHEVDIPIQAEWVFPSIQHLIGRREELSDENGQLDYSKITKVMSHSAAITQCALFLRNHLDHATIEQVGSTVEGSRLTSLNPGRGWSSLGTALGAAKYGMDILVPNVSDHDNNFTRFLLVGPQPAGLPDTEQQKTTILVTLPEDYPGALHQVLSAFAWRRINLTKIESRPTKKKLGNYFFYIDIKASMQSDLLRFALQEIESIGCVVRLLGSYPSYTYHNVPAEV